MDPIAREMPIAVFDSGVGGLTVLHECLVTLPHEDFVYLGDTARFPYGNHTADELRKFALELTQELVALGTKLIVIACNSATAAALPTLRENLGDRIGVVGVVWPEARLAAEVTRSGRIALVATPATVARRVYERALEEVAPAAKLLSVESSDLATLIQEREEFDEDVVDAVERACEPLREAGVDTVILGCTHYPLVRRIFQRCLGRGVEIVSSGQAISQAVEHELEIRGLKSNSENRGKYSFICTGDPEFFRRAGTRFLQLPLGEVRQHQVIAEDCR